MKVFITGGCGFIGRHLTRHLLENNFKVTVFDNFSNCAESISGAQVIKGDIRDAHVVMNALQDHDVAVHLASKISISDSEKTIMEVNVEGSRNVVKGCTEYDIALIAASSAAVYGEGVKGVLRDENSMTNPISAYGKSKLEMEDMIKEAADNEGLKSIILRLFNVYGTGQSDAYAGVVKRFVSHVRKGTPLVIFGDGSQARDFVHVDDVVQFMRRALVDIRAEKASIYNIGSGRTITITELADLICATVNKKPEVSHRSSVPGDIKYSGAIISKAEKRFRYTPKIALQEGVRKTFHGTDETLKI